MHHCLFFKTNAINIKHLPKRALQTLVIEEKVGKEKKNPFRLLCWDLLYYDLEERGLCELVILGLDFYT
jgi:hypothetical protein